MSFEKFVSLITAIITCIPAALTFPLTLDTDCFINLIGEGIETESIAPFMKSKYSTEFSYTFSVILQYPNISVDEEIVGKATNLSLNESYLRFNQKWRSSCITINLYTLTFNETVAAIHNSGFGTSDDALFFVNLPSSIEWNDHVLKFAALHNYSPFIFHANIIFMSSNSKKIGVHCYFCAPNPTRLHLINITSFQTYYDLRRFTQHLNANGYGRHILIQSSIGNLHIDNCLKVSSDKYQNRQKFYQHLGKYCSPPSIIIYLVTQHAMNATCITDEKDVPDHEYDDFEWFIHARFEETLINEIPTEITATRGSILIMQNYKLKVLSCVTIKSIFQKLDFIFGSVIHVSVWFSLLITSLAYMILYNNWSLGLDTMWPLFSQPCWQTHPKRLIFMHWICMIFISSIYSSSISSESVQLQDFPSLAKLYKKGFKYWLIEKRVVSKVQRRLEKELFVNIVKGILGRDTLGHGKFRDTFDEAIDFTYDGNGSQFVHVPEYQNLSKLINSLTSQNLLLGTPAAVRSFGRAAVSEGVIYFQNTKVCKFFTIDDVKIMLTLRVWSYLSYRSATLLKRFTENGIPERFENLQLDTKKNAIKDLTVVATNKCVPPIPIKIKSAVGISVLVLFALGSRQSINNNFKYITPDCATMSLLRSALLSKTSKPPGIKSTNSLISSEILSSTDKNEEIRFLRDELSKLRQDFRDYQLRAEKMENNLMANNIELSSKLQNFVLETQTWNNMTLKFQKLNDEIQGLKNINQDLQLETSHQYSILLASKTQELSDQHEKFSCEINAYNLVFNELSKQNEKLRAELKKKCAEFRNLELKHGELEILFNDLNYRSDELKLKNQKLEMTLSQRTKDGVKTQQNCNPEIKDFTNNIITEFEKIVGKLELEMALEKQKPADLEEQCLHLAQKEAQLEALVEIKINLEEKIRKVQRKKGKEIRKMTQKRHYELKNFVDQFNAMRNQLMKLTNSKHQLQTPTKRRPARLAESAKAHERKITMSDVNREVSNEQDFYQLPNIPSVEIVTVGKWDGRSHETIEYSVAEFVNFPPRRPYV
ncbi:unnamed protein product [Orchesella dallaii]|uniref:Uncharacterized protein n=1 Tax=Orchesella dallaii TaxID=48710 RepID=A0ABP1RZW4_9HEXA